jgi:hypothetical protein
VAAWESRATAADNSLRITTEAHEDGDAGDPDRTVSRTSGGGWFLARCPGRIGEYLALTGQLFDGAGARTAGWPMACWPAPNCRSCGERLGRDGLGALQALHEHLRISSAPTHDLAPPPRAPSTVLLRLGYGERHVAALEADGSPWAAQHSLPPCASVRR